MSAKWLGVLLFFSLVTLLLLLIPSIWQCPPVSSLPRSCFFPTHVRFSPVKVSRNPQRLEGSAVEITAHAICFEWKWTHPLGIKGEELRKPTFAARNCKTLHPGWAFKLNFWPVSSVANVDRFQMIAVLGQKCGTKIFFLKWMLVVE